MKTLLIILFIVIAVEPINSYRILGLFPNSIRSHFMFYEKIMMTLVKKGHEVHILSHFPQERIIERYKDVSLSGSLPLLFNNISISDLSNQFVFENAIALFKLGTAACEAALAHREVINLKESKIRYDIIVTEVFATDCLLGFAHLLQVPVVGVSSTAMMPWGDERMGNPDNPAYINNYFIPRRGKLPLHRKIEMLFANVASKIWYHILSTIPSDIRSKKFFGNDLPPLNRIAENTSILLVNTHFSLDGPRPNVPGVIEIGGLHIDTPTKIPLVLSKFIGKTEGIIYFSMGTVVNMATFDRNKLRHILKVLGNQSEKVIWKGFKTDLSIPIPSNIFVDPWLPQLGLLCDPRMKLFITHGGMMGIQEAAYCGVPIIGIPLEPNQKLNIQNYEAHNAGILLDYSDINGETFSYSISKILKNNSYAYNAKQISKLFKDRPQKPLDTAIYWIEYAVRNGGKHLRTKGADLIIFEYLLIDVFIVFAGIAFISAIMFFFALNFLIPISTLVPESIIKTSNGNMKENKKQTDNENTKDNKKSNKNEN